MSETRVQPFHTALKEWQDATGVADDAAAEQCNVTVETFRDWKQGSQPGFDLESKIRDVTGYDFRNWRFQQVRNHILAEDAAFAQDPWFATATTKEAFRTLLMECNAIMSFDDIGAVVGLEKTQVSSLRGFLRGEIGLFREEQLARYLRGLPHLRTLVTGERLTVHSPARHLIARAKQAMEALGLTPYKAAQRIPTTPEHFRNLLATKEPGAMSKTLRQKLLAFVEATREEIAARSGKPLTSRWPQFLPRLQALTQGGGNAWTPKALAERLGVSEERLRKWLRSEGHPTSEELDRIDVFLRDPTGAQPARPAPQPPPPSREDTAGAEASTRRPGLRIEDVAADVTALRTQLAPLLRLLAPSDDVVVAGGTPDPERPGLRFVLTRESFRPLTGVALTDDEIADTAALITELRRRINVITEASDIHAKRMLHDEILELYHSLMAFDSLDPTRLFDILEGSRRMLGSPRGGGGQRLQNDKERSP